MTTLEYGGLELGDTVLYNSPEKGLVPAVVESIFIPESKKGPPAIGLCYFITGFHGGCAPVSRADHGKGPKQWLLKSEAAEIQADESKARTDVENKHLAALKELEELTKAKAG